MLLCNVRSADRSRSPEICEERAERKSVTERERGRKKEGTINNKRK
jgi:hypothetical protein